MENSPQEQIREWCRTHFYWQVLEETSIYSKLGVADKFLVKSLADSYAERAFEIIGTPSPLESINSKNVSNRLTTFGFPVL